MDEMPDGCCILQVTVAETGYVFRLWNDGHATEAWPAVAEATLSPFDTSLAYDEGRKRFAERQRAAWSPLLGTHDGATLGPFVPEGAVIPGGLRAKTETIVFRTRGDDGVRAATIRGDLRVPASLGPLEPGWTDLHDALWGRRH